MQHAGMGFVDICVASMVMLPRRTDASPFITLWSEPVVMVGATKAFRAALCGRVARLVFKSIQGMICPSVASAGGLLSSKLPLWPFNFWKWPPLDPHEASDALRGTHSGMT